MSAGLSFRNGAPGYYEDMPWSLPPKAVRSLALPIDDPILNDVAARNMSRLALEASRALAAVLPAGTGLWIPPAGTLHTTSAIVIIAYKGSSSEPVTTTRTAYVDGIETVRPVRSPDTMYPGVTEPASAKEASDPSSGWTPLGRSSIVAGLTGAARKGSARKGSAAG